MRKRIVFSLMASILLLLSDGMTDEEYLADPIGLDVGSYVKDLMRYCPENVVDQVMEHQDALLRRLGTDYLSVIAFMPYEEDGGVRYA